MSVVTNAVAPDPSDAGDSGAAVSTTCHTVANSTSGIDTAVVRTREALPADAVVIVADGCTVAPPPDRGVWGLQVIAADTAVEGGGLELLAAVPLSAQPDPQRHDGDVVVQLRTMATVPAEGHAFVDVDVLVAREGAWKRVETWTGMDAGWPHRVVPALTRLMRCDASPIVDSSTPSAVGVRFGVLRDMVSAGLLSEGETLLCLRPGTGARYEAHVVDGGIQLPDGRWFAYPSGALTALGYRHQNGWTWWRRARDGVALGEIRLTPQQQKRRQQGAPPLRSMVADGTLRADDKVRFVQPRKGTVHEARVLADGRLHLADGRICATPSAAITACDRTLTAGWEKWRRVSDNRTLAELRDEHRTGVSPAQAQQADEPQTSSSSSQQLPSTPSAM